MRRVLVLAAAFSLLAAPAVGQVVSPRPDKVGIVVYPGQGENGLVLVTERRTVDLAAGRNRVSFRGVADGIVPQTVAVQGLPGGVAEQNFDYNLLTPGALLQAAEGMTATLVRTNPVTGKATEERARILSGPQGVVLDINGRLEALKCSGAPEKLVLDGLPPGFTDKPTLSIDAVIPKAGHYDLTVSYLALGVSWQANYVAKLAPDLRHLSLTSWITIDNKSAASFPEAPIHVIAGQLDRTEDETRAPGPQEITAEDGCWEINSGRSGAPPPPPPPPMMAPLPVAAPMMARTELDESVAEMVVVTSAVQRDIGDYKLYTLPEPTTLAPFQTKQLLMFGKPEVAVAIVHRASFDTIRDVPARGYEDEVFARDVIRFHNDSKSGLGVPLPRGKVALMRPFEGRDLLVDELSIKDTPLDLPGEFILSETSQAMVRNKVLDVWTVGEGDRKRRRARIEITAVNPDSRPARFEIRESREAYSFRIVQSSRPSTVEQGAAAWTLDAPAGGEAKLTYTLEWSDGN